MFSVRLNQYCDGWYNYLSMAIAISVNTDAQMLRLATNCDILQNRVPKGQFEFSMYTKLSVVFRVETIASAIERFTVGGKQISQKFNCKCLNKNVWFEPSNTEQIYEENLECRFSLDCLDHFFGANSERYQPQGAANLAALSSTLFHQTNWIELQTYKIICDRSHPFVRHDDPYHNEIANCCNHNHSCK